MEDEKKAINNENMGQKKLPPRPMPPRPMPPRPPMKKQDSAGDVTNAQSVKVEVQKPVVDDSKQTPEKFSSPSDNMGVQSIKADREKNKKIKQTNNEKRSSQRAKGSFNKKKFWIIFSCVLAGIGLVVGLVFLIMAYLPAKPLDAPNNLMISQTNQIVYATCSDVEGAEKYIFEVDGKKYDSKTPSLDLSKFSEPREYSIKVYAMGDKKGSLSSSSKTIIFDLRKILQAPTIHFYESGSSVICWAKVENATSYELLVNNQTKDLGDVLSFDLNSLGGGAYAVQVRAKSTKQGYVNSDLSNQLSKSIYETLTSPTGRVLSGGRIEIDKVENAVRYDVIINSKKFGVVKFDEERLIVDLRGAGIDKDTVITYFKIEAIGENFFVSNSAELDTTINLA